MIHKELCQGMVMRVIWSKRSIVMKGIIGVYFSFCHEVEENLTVSSFACRVRFMWRSNTYNHIMSLFE